VARTASPDGSAASLGHAGDDNSGPRVRCFFPPCAFTDTLCLLKTAEGRTIIARSCHVSQV
jgi:hypothetical protein